MLFLPSFVSRCFKFIFFPKGCSILKASAAFSAFAQEMASDWQRAQDAVQAGGCQRAVLSSPGETELSHIP